MSDDGYGGGGGGGDDYDYDGPRFVPLSHPLKRHIADSLPVLTMALSCVQWYLVIVITLIARAGREL